MRRRLISLLLGVTLLPYVLSATPGTSYTFTIIDVPFPGAVGTVPLGINDRGTIVGFYSDDSDVINHGFILEDGVYRTFDVPSAISDNKAFGINNQGQVVGRYSDAAGSHGFVFDKGTFMSIDVPGAHLTEALAVNDRGQSVGVFSDSGGDHAFLYDRGVFTSIDAPPAGAAHTSAFGINNRSQIVGRYLGGGTHGYLYDGRVFETIDFPDAFVVTETAGINDGGVIVGKYQGRDLRDHGFVYERGAFSTFDVPSANDTHLYGINNRGEIVGVYTDRTGNHAFIATRRR